MLDYLLYPQEQIYPTSKESFPRKNNLLDDYWKKKSRINRIKPIISKIVSYSTLTYPIYSPLVALECLEKLAEINFKEYILRDYGNLNITNKSRKEIGKILQPIYYDNLIPNDSQNWENPPDICTSAYQIFQTIYNYEDFALCIYEIPCKSLEKLSLLTTTDFFQKLVMLSQFQIGLADLMHLVVAKHMGCKNFITYDSDFIRTKKEIKEVFDLEVLSDVQEIERKL